MSYGRIKLSRKIQGKAKKGNWLFWADEREDRHRKKLKKRRNMDGKKQFKHNKSSRTSGLTIRGNTILEAPNFRKFEKNVMLTLK